MFINYLYHLIVRAGHDSMYCELHTEWRVFVKDRGERILVRIRHVSPDFKLLEMTID